MKTEIEKVNKIKPFDPFKFSLVFEEPEEVYKVLNSLEYLSEQPLELPDPLFEIYDKLNNELKIQGFSKSGELLP